MKFKANLPILAAVLLAVPALAQDPEFSADIAEIEERIEDAEKTIASFDGGVIQTLAQYRLETLKLNRALLENRQLGTEAGLNPDLVVPAVEPDAEKAAAILADIQHQLKVIETSELEASGSGGLVQAMAFTRVETEKLALAQLQLAWFQAQYGIATPQLAVASPPAELADNDGMNETDVETTPAWADPDSPNIDYTSSLFSGLAEQGFRMAGWYGILETRAEIDDSPKVLAINFSEYDPNAYQDNRRLLLQCTEGEPSIVYDVDSYMSYNYRSDSVRVTYRIDEDDAVETSWGKLTSNEGTGVFGASSTEIMIDLIESQKFFIRTFDNNGKTYDASFDMQGTKKCHRSGSSGLRFLYSSTVPR